MFRKGKTMETIKKDEWLWNEDLNRQSTEEF